MINHYGKKHKIDEAVLWSFNPNPKQQINEQISIEKRPNEKIVE